MKITLYIVDKDDSDASGTEGYAATFQTNDPAKGAPGPTDAKFTIATLSQTDFAALPAEGTPVIFTLTTS